LGGSGEKVPAALPVLCQIGVHEPYIRLVDQGRSLQRLPGVFLGHFVRGQFAELVVDQRQQLLRRAGVSLLHRRQNLGDASHVHQTTAETGQSQQNSPADRSRIKPSATVIPPGKSPRTVCPTSCQRGPCRRLFRGGHC